MGTHVSYIKKYTSWKSLKLHILVRISSLSEVIEENKTHLKRNCLLVNRIKEMGLDGNSNDIYATMQRLNQFEQKCRSYEQLCEKVVKEKIRLEQKVFATKCLIPFSQKDTFTFLFFHGCTGWSKKTSLFFYLLWLTTTSTNWLVLRYA